MVDSRKSKNQLISELESLRTRLAASERNAKPTPRPEPAPEPVTVRGATLAESDRRFLDLVQGSLQGVLVHRDFTILFASQGLAQMLGYASGEAMVGLDFAAIVLSDELEAHRASYVRLMANSLEPRIFECKGLRRDGAVIQAQVFATVIDWDGAPAAQLTIQDITVRKRAEHSLGEYHRLLETVFDAIPLKIYVKDREGRYITVNQQVLDESGLTLNAFRGHRVKDIAYGTDEERAKSEAADQKVLESGEPLDLPDRSYTDKHGVLHLQHVRKTPLRNDAGKVLGLVGISEDITERRRAEEALKESESRLRLLTEAVPGMIAYVDAGQRFRFVNKSLQDWMARDEKDILGKLMSEVTSPEAYAILLPYVGRALGGEKVEFEAVLPYPDGITRRIHAIYIPDIGVGGDIAGYSAMVEDITERSEAEEKLRTSQELFRVVFDTIPTGIVVRDRNDRISMVNKAHAANVHMSTDEIVASPDAYPHIDPMQQEEVRALNRKVLETGESLEMEWNRRWRDGRETINREYRVPIKDAQGGVSGLVVVSEDITQRKILEEQLLRAQKLEAVGELAGGIAHEFNNLLQIISASVDVALRQIPEEDVTYRLMQSVQKAGERGALLVRQLLGFGRRQIIQPTKLNVNEQISAMVILITSTMGERIQMVFMPGRGLKAVLADAGTFEQVIVNLCINARDAMPDGGKITLETANVELDQAFVEAHPWARVGNFVRITVGDTGEGMAPEVLERIFEPFYTTKGPQQGSGLGLSMVYGAIKQHSGLIDVSSAPGAGTRFALYFPTAVTRSAPEAELANASEPLPGGSRGMVLIAEDEEQLRILISQILERAGFETICAANGEEAIKQFEAQEDRIKLVLLDLVMPILGGGEAYDRIRLTHPDIPVIFQTGYDPVSARIDKWINQGLPVLRKPYSTNELVEMVEEQLAMKALSAG